jgi:hypothetical protein
MALVEVRKPSYTEVDTTFDNHSTEYSSIHLTWKAPSDYANDAWSTKRPTQIAQVSAIMIIRLGVFTMPPARGGNHPSEALVAFCKALDQSSDLQSKVKAAENPQQMIEIAASVGHEISRVELRVCSRELSADYFPWAAKGHEWRRNFFKEGE